MPWAPRPRGATALARARALVGQRVGDVATALGVSSVKGEDPMLARVAPQAVVVVMEALEEGGQVGVTLVWEGQGVTLVWQRQAGVQTLNPEAL